MRTLTKTIAALSLALVLSACSTSQFLTSSEPPQTIYSLRPVQASGEGSPSPARIVEIAAVTVPPGMDRDRIALYLDQGSKLDYYAAARWSAPLDTLLQEFTRRTASATLPYVVAVTSDQGIPAEYKLQMKINEFQPVYTGDQTSAPMLKISAEFTLIRLPDDMIVSNFTLSKQEAAQDNRLDAITLGLERLLQEVERDAFLKIDAKLKAR